MVGGLDGVVAGPRPSWRPQRPEARVRSRSTCVRTCTLSVQNPRVLTARWPRHILRRPLGHGPWAMGHGPRDTTGPLAVGR